MNIPKFNQYYPNESLMSKDQKDFYKYIESQLCSGLYPSVESNISYLFVYVYKLLNSWEKISFENLYTRLLNLAEGYYTEPKFAAYCKLWSYDCLLALKKYEDFIDSSEPNTPFGIDTKTSNLRLNVEYTCGMPANIIDLFKSGNGYVTKITKAYPGLFKEALMKYQNENSKEWFDKLIGELGPNAHKYNHTLFCGAPIAQPAVNLNCYCFYLAKEFLNSLNPYIREAENYVRNNNGLPYVGEGWISETSLFKAIEKAFPETNVIHHGHPVWLGKQHFDIWIPHWYIAVEYQGIQHFIPVDAFGGEAAFIETKKRDKRKVNLAEGNKVELIIATEGDKHEDIINKIKKKRAAMITEDNNY